MNATRRDIMGGIGGAGLAAIAAAAFATPETATGATSGASPDGELIRLCAEFDETERRYLGLHGDGPHAHLHVADDAEREPFIAQLDESRSNLFDQVCEQQATTLEGHQAMARTLALYDSDLFRRGAEGGCWNDRLLVALVSGLTGGRVA